PVTVTTFNLTPTGSGGCPFTFFLPYPTATSPPLGLSNLSFAGTILGGSTPGCTLYTIDLQVTGTGAFGVTLSQADVLSAGTELLSPSGLTSGSYTAVTGPTVTNTPTATSTPTSSPTNTPTP